MSPVNSGTPSGPDYQPALDAFEQALRDARDLDARDRETLIAHFRDALGSADPEAPPALPPRQPWLDTLDMLRHAGVLAARDQDELLTVYDRSMEPLQTEAVRRALGFAERAAADAALAQQRLAGTTPSAADAGAAALPPHLLGLLRPAGA